MSKMYGKRRVVLAAKPGRSGRHLVSMSGGKSHIPLGVWYASGGLFYADLKSHEQMYRLVSSEDIANKGLGGCKTRQALREFVTDYFVRTLGRTACTS